MAALPAAANGCAIVRPTRWGRSAAIDPHGRVVAAADHVGGSGVTLWADVPARRVVTLYARLAARATRTPGPGSHRRRSASRV